MRGRQVPLCTVKEQRRNPVAMFLVTLDVFTWKSVVFLPFWRVIHMINEILLNLFICGSPWEQ